MQSSVGCRYIAGVSDTGAYWGSTTAVYQYADKLAKPLTSFTRNRAFTQGVDAAVHTRYAFRESWGVCCAQEFLRQSPKEARGGGAKGYLLLCGK